MGATFNLGFSQPSTRLTITLTDVENIVVSEVSVNKHSQRRISVTYGNLADTPVGSCVRVMDRTIREGSDISPSSRAEKPQGLWVRKREGKS